MLQNDPFGSFCNTFDFPLEHSAILSTLVKLQFVIKIEFYVCLSKDRFYCSCCAKLYAHAYLRTRRCVSDINEDSASKGDGTNSFPIDPNTNTSAEISLLSAFRQLSSVTQGLNTSSDNLNSLDPDQVKQNVGPHLDPNRWHSDSVSERYF